jgi:hypothetical protein
MATSQPPTTGGVAGANQKFSFGDEEFPLPQTAPKTQAPSPAVAGAIRDLQREYAVECLRIASILAGHAADNAELGFDLIGETDLRAALAHFREGARAYRELLQAGGQR